MTAYLSISIIFLTAIGQVFLKKSAMLDKRILLNKYIFLGYSTFIIVVFLSMTLMKYLPLKYFSILVSFNYPATILFAAILLKEKISRRTILACILIVCGGMIFNV